MIMTRKGKLSFLFETPNIVLARDCLFTNQISHD